MPKRLSITPRDGLKKINSRWQRNFAEEAAEILIREGRTGEVLSRISGLTAQELSQRYSKSLANPKDSGRSDRNNLSPSPTAKPRVSTLDKQENESCSSVVDAMFEDQVTLF